MGKLIETNPDGTWSVVGVDFKGCKGNVYGALCKLRDYEKTGLEPSDFRAKNYDKKYLYKVHYGGYDSSEIKWIYCETRKNAEEIADILRQVGYDAGVNQWSWQAFIEE